MGQVFRVERRRTLGGKTTVEVAYGLTSLTPEQADPTKLLALTRGHWGIENSLHYVRDVTLGEDACRVRSGSAPQVLAALRNLVLHLIAPLQAPSNAAAIRTLAAKPSLALSLVRSLPNL